ncbi:hypothetical protein D3C78_823700 [compost metagenome]
MHNLLNDFPVSRFFRRFTVHRILKSHKYSTFSRRYRLAILKPSMNRYLRILHSLQHIIPFHADLIEFGIVGCSQILIKLNRCTSYTARRPAERTANGTAPRPSGLLSARLAAICRLTHTYSILKCLLKLSLQRFNLLTQPDYF